ncbi:amino acid permease [Paenibacillus barcinonensis]|uniref:Amino acid permease n=1 Tax=Paenibacillus barcinonensis TaxID=198119 RepID=A0A2V4WCK4_PAEBA|nr:amino acid permease [Paenibacillus barcinonensis]PYE49183.1 amino acid/polyamine/organocation transporter (APC superfamily) [Paenibacillus barcinonensis]QKS55418.1 amino acid permease [Paenibacillus barcinonensis]
MKSRAHRQQEQQSLGWMSLALFGAGCTLGTGFFLGSSLAIRWSGLFVLVLLLLAATGTYFVYGALAEMTADDPKEGAFRTYAGETFGAWAGFGSGWMYWTSEMLIMGSSLTALGLFSQFWFPDFPLWAFVAIYACAGLCIAALGAKGITQTENILAVIKLAATVAFIVIAGAACLHWLPVHRLVSPSWNHNTWFPQGLRGAWTGFIYAFFAFAGIEVMGLMAARLKKPEEAIKSGRVMLFSVSTLYIMAIALVLLLLPAAQITPDESPLVRAISSIGLRVFVHILNGVLIIAGFSTMVASLYAITSMLVKLGEDGDAPKLLTKTAGKIKMPIYALICTAAGLILSTVMAFLLPKKLFEYVTTAGSLVLMYTWLLICITYLCKMKPAAWGRIKAWIAILLIGIAVAGTASEKTSRIGLLVSIGLVLLLSVVTYVVHRSRRSKQHKPTT